MKRIEFVLSMPSVNSWNGRWSGADRHYAIVRQMTDKATARLLGDKPKDSWRHNFGDGWAASVSARIVPRGERLRKSNGFCGYDWMVRNIIAHGSTQNAVMTPGRRDDGSEPATKGEDRG